MGVAFCLLAFILCWREHQHSCCHCCISTQLQHGLKKDSPPRVPRAASPHLEGLRTSDSVVGVGGISDTLRWTSDDQFSLSESSVALGIHFCLPSDTVQL